MPLGYRQPSTTNFGKVESGKINDSSRGSSKRSSVSGVSHSILSGEHIVQLGEASLGTQMIIVCIADLYALGPRLAFSGTPRNDDFQRTLFWLQETSSILYIIISLLTMFLAYSIQSKKLAEDKEHASRHTSSHEVTSAKIFSMQSTFFLRSFVIQILVASLVPTITDLAMFANPKARRHWKWIGVLRLLHLTTFQDVFSKLDTNLHVPHWVPPTLRNTLMLFFNTHYAACVFWFLARRKNFSSNTWVTTHADFLIDSSTNTQYLYSLYYAVTTASTVGYGDYSPVSSSEVTVMISYVLINVLLVANIVGCVSALATMHDTDIAEQRIRIARFTRMLKHENISDEVALATQEFLRLGLKMDTRCDIDTLPVSVRIRIRDERFGHLIECLPLFHGVSHRFIAKCIAIAKDDAFVKGVEIIRTGDLDSRLFIILQGHATIDLPTDYPSFGHLDGSADNEQLAQGDDTSDETCTVANLGAGASFGAECFVCQLQQPWTIMAKNLLRVISFDDNDREELESTFPNDWFKVQSNLLEITQSIRKAAESLVPQEEVQSEKAFHPYTHEALKDTANSTSHLQIVHKNDDVQFIELKHVSNKKAQQDNIVRIDELHLSLESNILHPNVIAGFAAATKTLQLAINHETTKASHELSALHCHVASTGDDIELGRLLDMVPVEAVPGDYDGRAPLHLAAAEGHIDCVKVLVKHGAALNPIDRFGRTPLIEAVLNGHDQIISVLVNSGAELKLSAPDLASRLCDASSKGHFDTVRRYLDAGACPNAADYDSRTALQLAAAVGNVNICKLLIRNGAEKALQDRWGHSAYDEAVYHKHSGEIIDLLKF